MASVTGGHLIALDDAYRRDCMGGSDSGNEAGRAQNGNSRISLGITPDKIAV